MRAEHIQHIQHIQLQLQLQLHRLYGIFTFKHIFKHDINPLNAELNPICYLLALLGAHFLHVSRIRVKSLTLRLLMSHTYIYIYIYGAPILEVSRSHTTTHLLRSWVRFPPGACIFVCCNCRALSGRGLCDELITRPKESYRLWCVVVCDLETSRMGAPYIYDISSLSVNE